MKHPCVNKCTPDHPSGYCQGCYRTVNEVRDYNGYTDDEKRLTHNRIKLRKLISINMVYGKWGENKNESQQ